MSRLAAGLALLLAACTPRPDPPTLYVAEPLPAHFPPMVVPEENPTTVEGVALGRKLYYDVRLSKGGARACATCHLQAGSFSSELALGVLPHVNLAWSRYFLWDGHTEGTLEDAMKMEVEDFFECEVERLQEPDLEELFGAAFGTPEATLERAALALAQFQRTLVSAGSRWDRYMAGDQSALSESEVRGWELFNSERAECFHCHATALFTDNRFHNNGLDAEVLGMGRAAVTGRRLDDGAWKTPTLRNVAKTAPYMHDNRFSTLEEVIDFYSTGVKLSPSLDSYIPNPWGGGSQLTAQQKADLVAFLRALSDERFVSDPALGAP